MYYTEEVGVYKVNGYKVCVKGDKQKQGKILEEYLADVPSELIKSNYYVGDGYIILTEIEKENFTVKELGHLKINKIFSTYTLAVLFRESIVEHVYAGVV